MKSIVVLISGSGSNLQAIIDDVHQTEVNAEIKAVLSNKSDAYGLERAAKAGIATHAHVREKGQSRESYDTGLSAIIDNYAPDLIVLAGFMRILSDEFVNRYLGKLINIHPSLLPDFKGLHTHQRALDAKVAWHGASVHFVTPELDDGPVILQGRVPVVAGDSADSLQQKVHKQEHVIYPQVIRWFAQDRLCMLDGKAFFDDQELTSVGYTGNSE